MKRILLLLLVLSFAAVLLVPAGMAASADAVQDDFSSAAEYSAPEYGTELKKGDRGESVRWLQDALNRVLGTSLTVDGSYGQNTENAVRDFQKSNRLPETGIADSETLLMLQTLIAPPAETTVPSDETESPEQTEAQSKSALQMEARADRDHVFRSYWSAYFRCFGLSLSHPGGLLRMIFQSGKTLVIGILIILGELLLFSIMFGGWKNADAGGGYVYKYIYSFSTEEAAGCFSMTAGLFLKLLLLFIVISPVIADYFFLRALFQLSGIKCILLALLFTLMRLAAAVALYYLLRIPFCVVLYLAVGLPLYLLYLVFELIRLKKPDSPFEFLALSDESLGDLLAITSGLLAVFLLFIVYVPDILVFVAK